jgi:hypothetical protein
MAGFSSHTTSGQCLLYLLVRQAKGFQVPLIIGDVAPKGIEIPIIGKHFEEPIIRAIPLIDDFLNYVVAFPNLKAHWPFIGLGARVAHHTQRHCFYYRFVRSGLSLSVEHRCTDRVSAVSKFFRGPTLNYLSTNASCRLEKTENWGRDGGEDHRTIVLNGSEFESTQRANKPQLVRNVPVRNDPVQSADVVH